MSSETNELSNQLRITLPQGRLQGTIYTSELNQQQYSAFLKIPYAKPPINKLRFMPPFPAEKWIGILDATKEGDACIHYCHFQHAMIGSEDCLYLNIYSPEPPCKITSPKAVIVYIHCGGNNWGSGSSSNFGGPDFIVHHDVIFITFNYRLHAFGFLNLDLPKCCGNMGLKDQVMALQWIKENVKYFGGDSNNISLYGASSGATDVHFHMMSPLSRGLFNKVILQGGYALSPPWGLMTNSLERAFQLGQFLGFRGNNSKRLLRFLKEKSAYDIAHISGPLRTALRKKSSAIPDVTPFRPCVEIFEEGAFLSCHPRQLLQNVASVPMLANICKEEGSNMFLIDPFAALANSLSHVVKENLYMYEMNPDILQHVSDKIQSFYFGDETDYSKLPMQVVKLWTDMWTCEWQQMLDFQAKIAPVFVYLFSFVGKFNHQKFHFIRQFCSQEMTERMGACHADDSSYFTRHKMMEQVRDVSLAFASKEIKVINNMAKMNTNFAKFGDPNGNLSENVVWRPHIPEKPCYLEFGYDLKVVDGRVNEERVRFWKDLIDYIKENERTESS